jgi:hypothetical protein
MVTFEPKTLTVVEDKGTQIMEAMILDEYRDSPNLKEYMSCFLAELDLLFAETEKVYLGRMLEYATGVQLDVIGEVLRLKRAIELPNTWFGFSDDGVVTIPGIAGMADENDPLNGGQFRDENNAGFEITPLDDLTYRRALATKAMCNNLYTADINTVYEVITMLLGRVIADMELRTSQTSITTVSTGRTVELRVASSEISIREGALVEYMSRYFIPTGTVFILNRTT